MTEETVESIKEIITKQRKKWMYLFEFIEEIDSIEDEETILFVANLVKAKHQELLKKKTNQNIKPLELELEASKELETQEKTQPTEETYRAKHNVEPLRNKDNTKQCYKCKEVKSDILPRLKSWASKDKLDGTQVLSNIVPDSSTVAFKEEGLISCPQALDSDKSCPIFKILIEALMSL